MNARDAQSLMMLFVYGMMGIACVSALLVWILKTVLHNIELKYYVDVFVNHKGQSFMEWEKFNCKKRKVNSDNPSLYSIELFNKKAPRVFPYDEKYAIKRKLDGKPTIMFVEIEGQFFPFTPNIESQDAQEVKKEIWDKKKIKDLSFMEMQKDFNKWKYVPKMGGAPWLIFMIIAGIGVIGIVIMLAMSKKKEVTGK